jgi:hypothetical protein
LSYSRQFLDYIHGAIDYGYGFLLARGQGVQAIAITFKVWDGCLQIGLG